MLNPSGSFTWNLLPNPIWYSAKPFRTTLKSLLIRRVVIFDVIASWLSSTIFKNLLYLNLAPYLFSSVDSAYLLVFVCTVEETNAGDCALLVLKYTFESTSIYRYFKSSISGTIPATANFFNLLFIFCFIRLGRKSPVLGLILIKTFPYWGGINSSPPNTEIDSVSG